MKIRKECLGQKYSTKSPFNACHFSGIISDDPENFALYKVLQLDVFEKNIPPMADILLEEIIEAGKPKKKKKDATSESNE